MTLDELGGMADSLDRLLRSDGWKVVVDHFEKKKLSSLRNMASADGPFSLQKHTQEYLTVSGMLTEVTMLKDTLLLQLNQKLGRK